MRQLISMVVLGVLVLATAAMAVMVPQLSVNPHFRTFDGLRYQFQGQGSTGTPLSDGQYQMVFEMYSVPTGGTALWSETQTITLSSGIGSVFLGEVTPIPLDVFGVLGGDTTTALYLEVSLNSEIITPRSRMVPTPFAHVAERLLGDVQTGNGHLTVSNIGSSGLDGVSVDLDAQEDRGGLVVSNIGSSGQDGVRFIVDPDSSGMIISNIGSSGQDGVRFVHKPLDTRLRISNLGSSGLDGVSIDLDATETNGQLTVSNIGSSGQDGVRFIADVDSSKIKISNIGSSGLDGVSIAVGPGENEIKLGIEHEDIGGSIFVNDDSAGAGLRFHDQFFDIMSEVELQAGDSNAFLTVSNIGSSGLDGVRIEPRKIVLRKKATGATVQTEILSMDLSGSNPMIIRPLTAVPTDDPVFRLQYDGNDRIVQRLYTPPTAPTAPGDSSEFSSSHLRIYDGLDRVVLENEGNGGKMALRRLQTGQTVETEIVALSLSSVEPIIFIRPPDALPADPFVTTYVYDNLDRRILHTHYSVPGEPGDSTQGSSTGMSIFEAPLRFDYDINGILFTDASGAPFQLSPQGDMQARGNVQLATGPTSTLSVGAGSLPGIRLFVDGDICATGGIGPCSDERFKKNIETIDNPIEKVNKLRGVTFDWRTDEFTDKNFSDKHQIGLIAQEVKEVLPEVVGQSDDGYYFVDYSRLTPVLVEALKEQQNTIDDLTQRLAKMEKAMTQMVNSQEKNETTKKYASKSN